jgi:hypothetical protein
MDLGERAAPFLFLVRDRAGQLAASFDAVLTGCGHPGGQDPAPWANCFAERFGGPSEQSSRTAC